MRAAVWLAVASIALSCGTLGYSVADWYKSRALEREALACARTSSGTDQDIVDCYTVRGLPAPEDL